MKEVTGNTLPDKIILNLSGRIDSGNAPAVDAEILKILGGASKLPLEINAENLEYISSAGLRLILRLRKDFPDMRITGVNSEVYEIFEMTGFTQMIKVEKAYRTVSIEGAEEIGRGANGIVYRIDKDNVVKVYINDVSLEDIQHERDVARKALILGIPTAIPYDVVRVGNSYGSVFELLNATSFSKILADEPEKMDWCVNEYIDLLRLIHRTVVPEGELPDFRDWAIDWVVFMQDYLPEAPGEKLLKMIKAIPHTDHMLHGDYHTKNVEYVDNEVLLIDMDTLCVGDPIFELASMYNAFIGYSEYDHSIVQKFQGIDHETAAAFWHKVLAAYLGTNNENKLRQVEDKARVIGYTRMIRRAIRKNLNQTEAERATIDLWTSELLELLERVDSLTFIYNEITVKASNENLDQVTDFVERILQDTECPAKTRMQIGIAVEEIFVNIASYAYRSGTGSAVIRVDISEDPAEAVIIFIDKGEKFDPLTRAEPDITLSAEEREIGGLGIFMTRKLMDEIDYAYRDGQNILTLKKKFG